jgi:hypothetical protein
MLMQVPSSASTWRPVAVHHGLEAAHRHFGRAATSVAAKQTIISVGISCFLFDGCF